MYCNRYKKCMNNYEAIMSQAPLEIRYIESPKSLEHDNIIEIDNEEDQLVPKVAGRN